jgi:peptidoglycan hydrolase-like protein with peptidoglycan-binding domain
MEKFNNSIKNSLEKKIKKGTTLPSNTINLGYFEAEDLSPSNSLMVIDSAAAIKENVIDIQNKRISLVANELGMLMDPSNGNTRFPTDEISISEIRNSDTNSAKYIDVLQLNQNQVGSFSVTDYFHSYYVSRFFSPQEIIKGTSFEKVEYGDYDLFDVIATLENQKDIIADNSISINDIYVTNGDGSPYADITGKPKYKIILESYKEKYISEFDKLVKIIVLLEDPAPSNLILIYPKIELDSTGNLVNQVLDYSEVINPVPLYTKEKEEAVVVDRSSRDSMSYAVKSSEKVEDKFASGGAFDSRGYNIYVNKKAIPDNRTYEVFNWRIVGKISRSLNYANRIDGIGLGNDQSAGYIKAAVIKANTKTTYVDHFKALAKLDQPNNPINKFNYRFKNPVAETNNIVKTVFDDTYWTVDFSQITIEQAQSFDFLILVVNSNTDISTYSDKINAFVRNGGCLFVEVEGTTIPNSVSSILPNSGISITSAVPTSTITYNRSASSPYSEINLYTENQSWDIISSDFDTGFGAYGKINNNGVALSAFSSTLANNAVVTNSVGPVVIQFKRNATETSGVTNGNIICNTVGINKKASSDFISGSTLNAGGTTTNTIVISSDSEGPLKFFYNSIISGITSKYYTTSNSSNSFAENITLPVLYHATSWKTAWCINGPVSQDNYSYNDILIKNDDVDEYALYNISREQNGDLYRTVDSRSYKQIFVEDFNRSIPSQYAELYSTVQNVTYYVEFSNQSISPKVGTLLDSPLYGNITTPYKTYSLSTGQENQSPAFKTSTISAPLNIPRNFGQFYIQDRYKSITNRRSSQPNVTDNLYHYSYNFKTKWRKVESLEAGVGIDYSHRLSFTLKIPAEYTPQGNAAVSTDGTPIAAGTKDKDVQWKFSPGAYTANEKAYLAPISTARVKIVRELSVKQDLIDYADNHNFTLSTYNPEGNHYPYTGDIDITNTPKQYSIDSGDIQTGDYVHYIQCTMVADGSKIIRDGQFGRATDAAVKAFQQRYGTGIVDGTVDSQTKSIMAYYWINQKELNRLDQKKDQIKEYYKSIKKQSIANRVIAFIDKAIDSVSPSVNVERGTISRITYTNSLKAPTTISANIYMKVPASVAGSNLIKSIKIRAGKSKIKVLSAQFSEIEYDSLDDAFAVIVSSNKKKSKNIIGSAGLTIEANVEAEISTLNIKKFPWKTLILKVQGSKLRPGQFGGTAEGISGQGIFIQSIKFNCNVDANAPGGDNEEPTVTPVNIDTYMDVYITKDLTNLTVSNTPRQETITGANFRSNSVFVSKFYVIDAATSQKVDIAYGASATNQVQIDAAFPSETERQISGINNFGSMKLKLANSAIHSTTPLITNTQAGLTGLEKSSTSTYLSYVSSSVSSSQVSSLYQLNLSYDVDISSILSTISYGGETVVGDHRHLYVSFLSPGQSLVSKISPTFKNSVSYIDGVVCLCDQNGNPVGKPAFNRSSGNSNDTINNNITNIYLEKNSDFRSDGLVYGFFDLSSRKFLGSDISYTEYIERNGDQNIYIAIIATDYDGNTVSDDIDFSGFSAIPVSSLQVPSKTICPIYNVHFADSVAIKVTPPPAYLEKRDPWHIGITSGSFVRSLDIPVNTIYNQDILWLKGYRSESSENISVKAYYDTTDYNSSGWSKILGDPFVDVVDEIPVLVDSRTIRIRQTPIASIHEPSDNLNYFASPIKPYLFIYTKSSLTAQWQQLKFSDIGSFNCSTGIIQFKLPIVPNDERLIKVTYATKQPSKPIKTLSGVNIKLNPYLYKDEVKFNKPKYIYITPRSIQVVGMGDLQVANGHVYEDKNILKYTEDSRIFNPTHPKYNPFALLMATIYVVDYTESSALDLKDLRIKGGGVSNNANIAEAISDHPHIRSNWDLMGADGMAYNMGGYVVVQLPSGVKDYLSDETIISTVRSALTVGVVFELQDNTGKEWSKV